MDLLNEAEITVSDEATMLREKLKAANEKLDKAQRDLETARQRISDLEKVDKGNRELLELMTGASVEAQKQLHLRSKQYYAAIQNLTDAKRLRERWVVIGGFLTSFIATAFAIGTIFIILGR